MHARRRHAPHEFPAPGAAAPDLASLGLEPAAEAWLEALRCVGRSSRLGPRGAPGAAHRGEEAIALAFLGVVAAGLGTTLRMHRPGARRPSFDEAWMLRLLAAIRAEDWDTVAFALASRLPQAARRQVRQLAGELSDCIDNLARAPTFPAVASQIQPAELHLIED